MTAVEPLESATYEFQEHENVPGHWSDVERPSASLRMTTSVLRLLAWVALMQFPLRLPWELRPVPRVTFHGARSADGIARAAPNIFGDGAPGFSSQERFTWVISCCGPRLV